ncbi:hypothetical protein B0A48_09588 [Cryoendolithus antarcticus]|uniref:Uncharacterized protein n=1 Tax=Cryoendolithus antarcticus TaxID=1507870 RepID=A0A1V8SZS1_9PEZI|nr:hypothetical protein B0A48_09588 [Cryoendolithus antarcticus]
MPHPDQLRRRTASCGTPRVVSQVPNAKRCIIIPVVAQRCYATPTVRSAVLALSATHLDFSIDPHCIDTVETKVARGIGSLQLYNTAIAALRVYIEQNDKPSRADVLFSCAALVCCDLMRGDCGQATKHVDHGSTLVRAWQQEVVCRPAGHRRDDELEEIGEVFRAFDLHATTFDDSRLPLLAVSRKNGGVGSTLPVEFANLQQAQRYLVQIQSSALVDLIQSAPHKSKQMFEVPRHVIVRRRATRASFQKWSSALACLETNVTRLSKMRSRKEEAALCVFKIHHRILQLLLEESFHEIDLRKPFDGAGDQLLLWAEQALKLRPAERCFSVDVGLGPSLFLLVLKTTQISLRQRGTRLLACLQKLEGWHKPQAMLRAVNDLTIWESYEEAQLHDNGAKMALEQVAEQAGKYGSGVERSSWLDASFVDNADAASTAAL